MSCEWEAGRLDLGVSLRHEIRVGEIHVGATCKQTVTEVLKVRKDIRSVPLERSTEGVEAVRVRVKERRVPNWDCQRTRKEKHSVARDAKEELGQGGAYRQESQ